MTIRTESANPWTINQLIELIGKDIKATKIFLDLSFQSIFRWDKSKQEKFLKCTLRGFATSPLVFACVSDCLTAARKRGDNESVQYFEKLEKEGKYYIIIDGNNRMTTLADFFNDKVGLPIGTYSNLQNPTVKYTVTGNKGQSTVKFSKLDGRLQLYLKAFLLNTTIVESISRRELSEFFDALNDGVKLNAQEIRNSWWSKLAEIVREAGDEHTAIFDRVVTQIKVNRRGHDEIIAHLITSCQSDQFGIDIKPKMVDAAYGKNVDYSSSVSQNCGDSLRYLKKTMDVVYHFQSNEITKSTFVDIFNIMRQHDHLFIQDNKKFAKYLMKVIIACKKDLKDILLEDNTGSFPYSGMLRQAYTAEYMKLRMEKLMKTFWTLNPKTAESLMSTSDEAQGIVKDEQRIFTPIQRYEIWQKQGERELRNGVEIPLCELNDSSKWQADHIVEWTKGGRTTVANGEILSVSDHMIKTADYNRKRQNENLAEKRAAMANPVSDEIREELPKRWGVSIDTKAIAELHDRGELFSMALDNFTKA